MGTASVVLSFDGWADGRVAPAVVRVPVVTPNAAPEPEAVSKRLRGELTHPGMTESLLGVRFSPDGRRLAAGEYPSGVVAIWDVASGRVLTSIQTGRGDVGTGLFELSPDWQTLYAPWTRRDHRPVERDGKRLIRMEMDGDVRAWDVASGQWRQTYKHRPPRGILQMQLSQDGTKLVTFEFLPGAYEPQEMPKETVSRWDVRSGEDVTVYEGVQSFQRFSRGGRLFAIAAQDHDRYTRSLKVFDAVIGRQIQAIPISDRLAQVIGLGFSPDGQTLVGDYFVYEAPGKWDNPQGSLKWWDTTTGREVASFPAERGDGMSSVRFSPDGRTLAVIYSEGDECKLKLFRVTERQLAKTLVLGKKTSAGSLSVSERVFSPDGRWLAVITQRLPEGVGRDPDPRDVPQPRIHLIDVATGEIRETLVAPQSFINSACFSPDGRTLATGGPGKVLLWDVSNLTVRR